MVPLRRRKTAYLILMSALVSYTAPVLADNNEYQPYTIPSDNPGDYDEIKKVVIEGESNDPHENIHKNLQEALSGGWDWNMEVNGVFEQEEAVCPPSVDEPIGARCEDDSNAEWEKTDRDEWTKKGTRSTQSDADMEANAKRTEPQRGLIPKVEGVPGRDTKRAYGNIRSGLGERREDGETAEDIRFNGQRRVKNGNFSGFDYPTDTDTTCGFTTVCRPRGHPDQRDTAPRPTYGPRGNPGFFCEHPCQRPLDGQPPIGKPEGWDPADSSKVRCGIQQPYEPQEDRVKYACGGLEMKGPGENFCLELEENGPKGGLCQDLNNWTYILWSKVVHVCYVVSIEEDENGFEYSQCNPVPIQRFEKGPCGFPEELGDLDRNVALCQDSYQASTVNECCSDDSYGSASVTPINGEDDDGNPIITDCDISVEFNEEYIGTSCKTCAGEDCRLFPDTNNVIIPDQWYSPFPPDLDGQCLVNAGDCDVVIDSGYEGKVNHGAWPQPPGDDERYSAEDLEYISYFRDYNEASYERSDELKKYVPDDDFKKEGIPVACYGMYDVAPEDAKIEQTEASDKRCTIGAYYEADDGDGDELNFWSMKETQRGKGAFIDRLNDNPFGNPTRPFVKEEDLWWPNLEGENINLGAFSMINDEVFADVFHGDFSFTLLTTDSAAQRSTVQLDTIRKLSSGALIRTPDDTITIEKDLRKHRRTLVEWWHIVETEMHKNLTLPTVRLLLPTTWTIDLNPLDPLYTPPIEPEPGDLSPDIRSESIEIQVQAREDLLGDVTSFMERALLLRIEGEPVPIVVPIVNPTELRAIAQGWETWAKKQENGDFSGMSEAREVSEKLLEYADQADNVRKLRAQLPRYAGTMLIEQRRVSQKLADWLDENLDNYKRYRQVEAGMQFYQTMWQQVQSMYRKSHDGKSFPWPRNERFTSPIYSLLDPWLPGRENDGDTTGGMESYIPCLQDIKTFDASACGQNGETLLQCYQNSIPRCAVTNMALFSNYFGCIEYVLIRKQEYGEGVFPTLDVCEQYFPIPPLMPQPPDTKRDADMVLDFTAFREPQRTIKLPILKTVQIRIDFDSIEPPPLEQDDEPTEYPELAPLPAFPDSLAEAIEDSLPIVINPAGQEDLESFKEAAVFSVDEESDPDDPFPKIKMPSIDLLRLQQFLTETFSLIENMSREYALFWDSMGIKKCEGGQRDGDCVASGTEQDCVEPHTDPKKKCVHFEADLKERLQRIGSRPAIFLKDDIRAIGKFRNPIIHGQAYCEREDWACQLYNFYERKPREGWMLDITDEYNPDELLLEVRKSVREQSSNIIENDDERFLYDMPQEEMFENFRVPEGERIERYIERFEPTPPN